MYKNFWGNREGTNFKEVLKENFFAYMLFFFGGALIGGILAARFANSSTLLELFSSDELKIVFRVIGALIGLAIGIPIDRYRRRQRETRAKDDDIMRD